MKSGKGRSRRSALPRPRFARVLPRWSQRGAPSLSQAGLSLVLCGRPATLLLVPPLGGAGTAGTPSSALRSCHAPAASCWYLEGETGGAVQHCCSGARGFHKHALRDRRVAPPDTLLGCCATCDPARPACVLRLRRTGWNAKPAGGTRSALTPSAPRNNASCVASRACCCRCAQAAQAASLLTMFVSAPVQKHARARSRTHSHTYTKTHKHSKELLAAVWPSPTCTSSPSLATHARTHTRTHSPRKCHRCWSSGHTVLAR